MSRDYYVDVRRRKRKRARRVAFVLLLVISIMLVALIGSVTYFVMHLTAVPGQWVCEYDFTDEVAGNVAIWLADIEGVNVDKEWVKSHTDTMAVTSVMDINKEALTKGTYKTYFDEQSYEECRQKSYSLMESCLEEIIAKKLVDSGYKESLTGDEASSVIEGVLSCSMSEYLINNGINVMPAYDEINSRILSEGEYELNIHYIKKNSVEGNTEERYIIDDDKFVLPEQSIVYRKQVE